MTIETAQPGPVDFVRRAEPAPAAERSAHRARERRSRWLWLLAVVVALALPWLFFNWSTGRHSGFVLIMLSEIGLMTIFALSFNMQMGQAGLLSFGHAILFGLGGYCTAHALNAIKAGGLWLPTELVPLVGGLGGLGFGILFGFIATKQRATAFAMITLGLGELVAAAALMFMGFFGGEGGISTNRVTGVSLLGASYSASWQVYYLIVAWTLISTVLMRLQTQTPLGRLANATRDNFERAEFVGYDPRMVRFYQYVLSGFFAGIAGALYAILYEIVTFDTVSAPKSATALLATYIGGVGGFYGPILGTILIVLLQSGVSLLSNAWLLYVGVLFIVMVMFAPNGILGLIAMHGPIARSGRLTALAGALPAGAGARSDRRWRLRSAGRDGVLCDHRRRAGQSPSSSAASPTSIRSRCRPGWRLRQHSWSPPCGCGSRLAPSAGSGTR